MEKKIEKKVSEVVITLSANGEEWASAQKKEFNKLAAKLNVPGFRKGHVPANIAQQRINKNQLIHDALYDMVNKEYVKIVNEEKIQGITDPQLMVNKADENEFEVEITVVLRPVVTLGEYKGIKVEKEEVNVTEEEVNGALTKELEKEATLVLKDDAAEIGDTVTIDFKGFIDDVPFEGGEAKSYDLKLGSNSFIPGFEDKLVGIKSDESRTIEVKFPDNYVESLAGKDAKFEVLCHEVKKTVLPELNDEFVKDLKLDNVESVDSYREKVKKDLLSQKQRAADNNHLNAIVDKIIESSTLDISDVIVAEEANAQIKSIKDQVEKNGLKFEDYLKINNITIEKLFEDKKVEALKNLKGMLVIQEICQKEKIVVDSKAYNDKVEELAKLYNMKIEDVRTALEPNKNEVLNNLKNELFSKFILANNE